jgi:nitrogen fixation protein FixH
MKINWGTAVVIAFGLFMSFILFFVFKVQSNHKYDNELVVEKYYQKEQEFNSDYQKEENAINLTNQILITNQNDGVWVTFPSEMNYKNIKGKVSLYRPSSQKLDSEIPISLSSPRLLIPKSNLVSGRWDISVDFEYEGKKYLSKKTIYY